MPWSSADTPLVLVLVLLLELRVRMKLVALLGVVRAAPRSATSLSTRRRNQFVVVSLVAAPN